MSLKLSKLSENIKNNNMDESTTIIRRRQHSTGLDTGLPVWVNRYDARKQNLYTTTPHTGI